MIDTIAQYHDYVYWQNGVGGLWGAKYNQAVKFADQDLVYSAVSIIERYEEGGYDKITGLAISQRTYNLARAVYMMFEPIVIQKFRNEGVIIDPIYPDSKR